MRIGNKQNAGLNGEYAKHVRWFLKRITAKRRRQIATKSSLKILGEKTDR